MAQSVMFPLGVQQVLLERARNDVIVPGLGSKVPWSSIIGGTMTALSWIANKVRLQTRMEEIEPDIRKLFPTDRVGGVLVLTNYCVTDADNMISDYKLFLSADAVMGGRTLIDAWNGWQKLQTGGTISAGCGEGWRKAQDYVWVTKF